MLTMGPHLYYADPVTMTLKGEIPWSPQLRVEPKNFRIFFVHTVIIRDNFFLFLVYTISQNDWLELVLL